MKHTVAQFRELAERPPVVQSILDALDSGDDDLAGYLLRVALDLMPNDNELTPTQVRELVRAAGMTP